MAVDSRIQDRPAEQMLHEGSARSGVFAAGGLLSALAAMSCCALPLALFALGAGGAWIGNLTALAPYQPLFLLAAVGSIGLGLYRAYGRRRAECAGTGACAQPRRGRLVKTALWLASAMVAAAVAFDVLAPTLLG